MVVKIEMETKYQLLNKKKVVKIEMEAKYQLLNKPKKVVKIKLRLKY